MSTAVMWLLLFVVVALGILIAALSKTKFTTQKIATIGIMAALSFVAYEFFRIPNVLGTGSSFHLGNTFTALTALMLDGVSGGLAGAIGLALADIMAGDPGYAITTFILKFIIGIVCGVFAHKVFKLQDLSAADGVKYYVAVIGSAFSGLLVNVFTDPFWATSVTAISLVKRLTWLPPWPKSPAALPDQLSAVHRVRCGAVPGAGARSAQSKPAARSR